MGGNEWIRKLNPVKMLVGIRGLLYNFLEISNRLLFVQQRLLRGIVWNGVWVHSSLQLDQNWKYLTVLKVLIKIYHCGMKDLGSNTYGVNPDLNCTFGSNVLMDITPRHGCRDRSPSEAYTPFNRHIGQHLTCIWNFLTFLSYLQ